MADDNTPLSPDSAKPSGSGLLSLLLAKPSGEPPKEKEGDSETEDQAPPRPSKALAKDLVRGIESRDPQIIAKVFDNLFEYLEARK